MRRASIFDDSNLFRIDKFSGWDRVEGGNRANYGMQYTAQINQGGFVNVLFGQSYNLFGQNSFAFGGTTNTGLDTGLDTTKSDYVARVSFNRTALTRSPHGSVSTVILSRSSEPSSRAGPLSIDGAAACFMATMPLSRLFWKF